MSCNPFDVMKSPDIERIDGNLIVKDCKGNVLLDIIAPPEHWGGLAEGLILAAARQAFDLGRGEGHRDRMQMLRDAIGV